LSRGSRGPRIGHTTGRRRRRLRARLFTGALGAATAATAAPAPLGAQDVRLTGQFRPRYEYRDPAADGRRDDSVTSRVRIGALVGLGQEIGLRLQLQDVRTWGEDRGSAASGLGAAEVHEAFVSIGGIGGAPLELHIGRQELAFGGERVLGAADWLQRGRSFDGIRATLGRETRVDAFATRTADRSAGRAADASLLGVYLTAPADAAGRFEAFVLYDRARGDARTDQATAGARWLLARPRFEIAAEANVQHGTRADADVRAWLASASAGPVLAGGRARIALAWDYASGGRPDDAVLRVIDTRWGTAHRYHGYADLFTNLPLHTGGRGLSNPAVHATWTASSDLALMLDLHAFRATESAGLVSPRLAEEADLTVRYRFRGAISLLGGISGVRAGPGLADLGRLERNMTWAFVMLTAGF
jgi:hypothetical protein